MVFGLPLTGGVYIFPESFPSPPIFDFRRSFGVPLVDGRVCR